MNLRPKFFSLMIFITLIGSQAIAQVGDLSKLKIYRTYYTIEMQSPMAHQVEVYFQEPDEEGNLRWKSRHIGIQENQDLSLLEEGDLLGISKFIAGWLQPPASYKNIPSKLEQQRPGIEAAMKRIMNSNNLTNFITVYSGYRALIDVRELVPITKTKPRQGSEVHWIGRISQRQLFVDLATNSMESVGGSSSGFGIILYNKTAEEVSKLPWWNFALPAEIEGSALTNLYYDKTGASSTHLKTHQNLQDGILAATRTLQSGSSVKTDLNTILARQGSSVLPKLFKQTMKYRVSIFGRVDRSGQLEQLNSEVNFLIPLDRANISQEIFDKKSGITAKLEGKLFSPTAGLKLTVKDPNGNSNVADLPISPDNPKPVVELNKIMMPWISLEWKFSQKFGLPGRGEYLAFDIYPKSEMSALPLTNAEID